MEDGLKLYIPYCPAWLIQKRKDLYRRSRISRDSGFRFSTGVFVYLRLPSTAKRWIRFTPLLWINGLKSSWPSGAGTAPKAFAPYIDFRLIKKNPKIFAGFSDLSTLLNAIYERTEPYHPSFPHDYKLSCAKIHGAVVFECR